MTLKILVADDSVTIQKIVKLAFAGEDALIVPVSSGDASLDAARSFKPDIVLADVFMPGCSGYDLCASIKEDPELAHTPVVLMVGAFEPFDEYEAVRVKSDGRLTKPFDPEELIQTVRSLAGKRAGCEPDAEAAEIERGEDRMIYSATANEPEPALPGARSRFNRRVWESFLGPERVLDLFDSTTLAAAAAAMAAVPASRPLPEGANTGPDRVIADEILNTIVEKVVRRMSADAVREVAWEVVPELSEAIIRRTLAERNKP